MPRIFDNLDRSLLPVIIPQEPGKKIYQSQLDCGDGKIFLVRVVAAEKISPPVVVTVSPVL